MIIVEYVDIAELKYLMSKVKKGNKVLIKKKVTEIGDPYWKSIDQVYNYHHEPVRSYHKNK